MAAPMSSRKQLRMRRTDRHVDAVIVGGGHAGLAMSAQLTSLGIDHVVLEAEDIGHRWRRERWESLTLLTPNWTLDLPGKQYAGQAPDQFMHKDVLADYLADYARESSAPVKRYTRVHRISAARDRYLVHTTQGDWYARAIVLATGAYANPVVPRLAESVPDTVAQVTARDYRSPRELPDGKVLVVGASATGLQFAQELAASGRDVMLAVGEHVRMPREVADHDIYWWLMKSGVFWETTNDVDDITRARRLPSPQLVGRSGVELNLNQVQDDGVEIVGRFAGVNAGKAQFSGNLPNLVKSADLKMRRLLQRFADTAPGVLTAHDLDFEPTDLGRPRLAADLGDEIKVVLWATGFKPDYSWLDLDVVDKKGRLQHDGGVVRAPGIYALGLPLMRSRASTFIAGTKADTLALAEHMHGYLDAQTGAVAQRA